MSYTLCCATFFYFKIVQLLLKVKQLVLLLIQCKKCTFRAFCHLLNKNILFVHSAMFFFFFWGVAARRLYRSGTQTLFVRLGFCLLLLGYGALASWQVYEYRSIETAYRDVLKLYPESLFALNDLGNHYFRQGDYQQSEELLRRAIIIAPGNTKVRRNLHRVLEHNHPQ